MDGDNPTDPRNILAFDPDKMKKAEKTLISFQRLAREWLVEKELEKHAHEVTLYEHAAHVPL